MSSCRCGRPAFGRRSSSSGVRVEGRRSKISATPRKMKTAWWRDSTWPKTELFQNWQRPSVRKIIISFARFVRVTQILDTYRMTDFLIIFPWYNYFSTFIRRRKTARWLLVPTPARQRRSNGRAKVI